jgi:hypothetical protein
MKIRFDYYIQSATDPIFGNGSYTTNKTNLPQNWRDYVKTKIAESYNKTNSIIITTYAIKLSNISRIENELFEDDCYSFECVDVAAEQNKENKQDNLYSYFGV